MRRYFVKIIAESLIAVVLLLGSSFCFQGLLGSVTKTFSSVIEIKAVQAASADDSSVGDTGVCSNAPAEGQSVFGQVDWTMPMPSDNHSDSHNDTNHNNSVLPCCVDGGHPSVISASQPLEISKLIPALFINVSLAAPKIIKETAAYSSPIMSPPELVSVRTTILRL